MDDSSDNTRLAASLRSIAEPVAATLEVEVLEIQVKGQGSRRLVRIVADTLDLDAQAGLDIDTIATFSRRLAKVLDEQDPISGAYNLEVTSPGADRPLRRPRDFARNIGREVRITRTADGTAPSSANAPGVVVAVTEDELTLERDGSHVVVPFQDIDHGTVVLPW